MNTKLLTSVLAAASLAAVGSTAVAERVTDDTGRDPGEIAAYDSPRANWERSSAKFREDMAKDLAKAREELNELRQKVAKQGAKASASTQQAVEKAQMDVERFEASLNRAASASADNWEAMKNDVKLSKKEAERSLDLADDKV